MLTLTILIELIESIFGKGNLSRNNNFDVRCPICNPDDIKKKKLSILIPSCMVHCWVCGFKSRTLAPLIRKYGSNKHMIRYREITGQYGDLNLIIPEVEIIQKIELPKDFRLLTLSSNMESIVRESWRYIDSRGLSSKDAWYFKFGISNEPRWKKRIIMPSFDAQGNLNYFVARAIDNKKPKYDNPDINKNPIVFNEINLDWTKQLILCEGPFDLVKCPENSTALLGSDLDERHEIFNKILMYNTPVALALDGDMWNKKTPKIVKKLQEYDVNVVIVDVRPWGDPGNMSKIEFIKALNEAIIPTWNSTFLNRLEKASSINFRM